MITAIIDYLSQAPEVQGFGLNIVTGMFLVAVLLNTWQGYGLVMQGKKIRKKESIEGIAPLFFIFQLMFFVSFEVQSFIFGTIGGMYAGLLFFLHVPILVGIFRYGKERVGKWSWRALMVIPLPPIAMAFYPEWSGELFIVASLGTIVANALQPLTMWRGKHVGAVEPRMFFAFLCASIMWTIYPLFIGNWSIALLSGIFGAMQASVLILYYRYR